MTIEFIITDNTVELLSNTDTGDNTLFINGVEIPTSSWVGSGYYVYDGISIKKISSLSGNVFCNKVSDAEYELNQKTSASISASEVSFDNTDTGLSAVDVQAAIEEVNSKSFVLSNKTLAFSNKVATVSDSRVTSSTHAIAYFTDGTLQAAVNAMVTVSTSSGVITFTAVNQPANNLVCDIVCS